MRTIIRISDIARYSLVVALMLPIQSQFGCKQKKENKEAELAASNDQERSQPTNISVFKDKDALPPCDKKSEGTLVYVQSDKNFMNCMAKVWTVFTNNTRTVTAAATDVALAIGDVWRGVWRDNVKSTAYIEGRYANSCGTLLYESGSGFVVANGIVATNGHVVNELVDDTGTCGSYRLNQLRIWFPVDASGDTQHIKRGADAEACYVDRSIAKQNDLALVFVSTGSRAAVKLSKREPAADKTSGEGVKLGEEVLQLGYSSGTTYAHFAMGKINAIQQTSNDSNRGFLAGLVADGVIEAGKTVYEYDLVSGAGASGSPIFDLIGEMIAVNFAGDTKNADTEFGYGVLARPLADLLSSARVWTAVADPDESCKNITP